jgi:hypothetical protein
MILAGDLFEPLRPQPVGQRMRRILGKAGGGEEIGHWINLVDQPGFKLGGRAFIIKWLMFRWDFKVD